MESEVEFQPDLKKTPLHQETQVTHTDSVNFDINSECEANAKESSQVPSNLYTIHAVL